MGLGKHIQERQIKWAREGDLSSTSLGDYSAEVSKVDTRFLVSVWNRNGVVLFEEGNVLTQRKGEILAEGFMRRTLKETNSRW